jgi:hypothetical protein
MKKDSGVLENCVSEISKALNSFADHESSAKRSLEQIASADPVLFFGAAINVVAGVQPSAGSRYLVVLLAKDKRLAKLADGSQCLHAQDCNGLGTGSR